MLLCCLQVRLAECGDSTKTQHKDVVDEGTPCSKVDGKKTADSVGSATNDVLGLGENSITKPVKLKCVKTEKDAQEIVFVLQWSL
jgi:hypothetical protein